jgi:hypothetical protein
VRLLVEVEGLRIEFGCESLGPLLVDPHPSRAEGLAHGEVFEISLGHCRLLEFVAVFSRPVFALALTKGAGHPGGRRPVSADPDAASQI